MRAVLVPSALSVTTVVAFGRRSLEAPGTIADRSRLGWAG